MSGAILLKQKTAEENYDSDPPFQRYVSRGELLVEIPPKERVPRADGSPSHNFSLHNDHAVTLYDDGTGVCPLNGPELDYLAAVTNPQTRIVQYLEAGKLEWIMSLKHGDIVVFRLKQPKQASSTAVLMIKGRIRYYGLIPGATGVMFGIEIMEPDYKGKGTTDGSPHFNCGHNNAVYVPMDKIIKVKEPAKGSNGSEVVTKEPKLRTGPAANLRSKSSTQKPNEDGKDKSFFGKAKGMIMDKVTRTPYTATNLPSDVHSKFSSGDHVVIQTADNLPVRGVVRWTGPMKMSKSVGGMIIPVVGIETERPIDHEREFPDLSYGVTGSHGQELFEVPLKCGRIFLSELAVLSADEYEQQKKKERAPEVKEAKKWGVSVDELNQQGEILAKTNEERDRQHDARHSKPHMLVPHEDEENKTVGGNFSRNSNQDIPIGPEGTLRMSEDSVKIQQEEYNRMSNAHKKRKSIDSDYEMVEMGDETRVRDTGGADGSTHNASNLSKSSHMYYPEDQDPEKHIHSQHGSCYQYKEYPEKSMQQHGGYPSNHELTQNPVHQPAVSQQYYDQQPNPQVPAVFPGHYDQQLNSLNSGRKDHQRHSPSLPSHLNDQQYNQEQFLHHQSQHGRSSTPPVGQIYHGITPKYPSLQVDASQFTVGTLVDVQMQTGHARHGTIRWMGSLPEFEGMYAGIELDYPLEKCSDGTFERKRYFTCPPGTGFFCLLSALQLDQRYMEPNQLPAARRQDMKNPLADMVTQYDDSDIPGGPELFSRYIGDEHGIQGHHNSCYLDATVFGLFALSDSFDMMLLEEPHTDIGQRIKHILWKGIVNPLRMYGLARYESIMELRNELENLGRMKGANKDEKDPEEFLNLLFKEILHVEPFISIKRPFGVENEFFVQLFFELEADETAPPTTEKLINKMFYEQKISFTSVPSKLLLQMPRFGKEFKMFNKIIPSLDMDTKTLLDPASGGVSKCSLCLGATPRVHCTECKEIIQTKELSIYLCESCSGVLHRQRPTHKYEEVITHGSTDDVSMFSKMQLLSVICIETSHYVCFTRTNDKWLFHDSMANRVYDMYNIPRVTDVSDQLNYWVYNPDNHKKLLKTPSREIPECVRRFTQDIYMCVYINPDLDRYGPAPPSEASLSTDTSVGERN